MQHPLVTASYLSDMTYRQVSWGQGDEMRQGGQGAARARCEWCPVVRRWVRPLMTAASAGDISEANIWEPHPQDETGGMAGRLGNAVIAAKAAGYRRWLVRAVLACVGREYYVMGLSRLLWLGAIVAQVLFLQRLLTFVMLGGSLAHAAGYAVGMAVASTVQSITMSSLMTYSMRGGSRIMGGLSVLLFRKSLTISMASLHTSSNAKGKGKGSASAVNLSQNDAHRIQEALSLLHFAWCVWLCV